MSGEKCDEKGREILEKLPLKVMEKSGKNEIVLQMSDKMLTLYFYILSKENNYQCYFLLHVYH